MFSFKNLSTYAKVVLAMYAVEIWVFPLALASIWCSTIAADEGAGSRDHIVPAITEIASAQIFERQDDLMRLGGKRGDTEGGASEPENFARNQAAGESRMGAPSPHRQHACDQRYHGGSRRRHRNGDRGDEDNRRRHTQSRATPISR